MKSPQNVGHRSRPGRRRTFSDIQERRILVLHSQGISYPRIASEVGLPSTTIEGLIQRKGLTKKERPLAIEPLRRLYVDQGLSMEKTGKLLGVPRTNVEYWLKKHSIERHPLRKYRRLPFSGDLFEKAYLLGLRFGDLCAVRRGEGILVTTTSTHPAMLLLFLTTFEKYGHVSFSPSYNQKYAEYQWVARVTLDLTFSFLLAKGGKVPHWIASDKAAIIWFLAGFIDAEGTVGIVFYLALGRYRIARPYLLVSNTDLPLLQNIAMLTKEYSSRLSLGRKGGTPTSRNGSIRKHDQWQLWISRREVLKDLLIILPLRHIEKIAKSALALKAISGCKWEQLKTEYENLRAETKKGVAELASLATAILRR